MGIDPRDVAAATVLAVYACRDGTMLFVPAGCEPVPEAIALHGPLALRGQIDVDARRSTIWRELVAQIDRHHFATVGLGEVALLLGEGVASLCRSPVTGATDA